MRTVILVWFVFVVAGPPIAGISYDLLFPVLLWLSGYAGFRHELVHGGNLSEIAMIVGFMFSMSYFVWFLPAALCGLVAGLHQKGGKRPGFIFSGLLGAGIGALCSLVAGESWQEARSMDNFDWRYFATFHLNHFLSMFMSVITCWFLTRNIGSSSAGRVDEHIVQPSPSLPRQSQ